MNISEADYARILKRQGQPAQKAVLPCPSEADEQVALFQWRDCRIARWPVLHLLHHIPNGEKRDKVTAARLKAMGVKAGIPDIHLPAPRGRFAGMYLELKRADHSNQPSPSQLAVIEALRAEGYCVEVAYGCDEAIDAITRYLED